jgi:prepilin-type N-terminal cleavage/methylation domain-containing protein/prepilin-type processing-associated H-X9-DG protein
MQPESKRGQAGFTVMELLVVVAIISILAGILMPVFAHLRENGRKSVCTSNVRQISMAILMYAQDFDENLPLLYDCAPVRAGLILVTQPYVRNWHVHDCPSADQKTVVDDYLGNRSYGYNSGGFGLERMFNYCESGPSATLGQISRPSEVVMMGDVMQDRNAPGRFSPPSAGPILTDYNGAHCRICGRKHNSMFQEPLAVGTAGSHNWEPRPGFNFIERHDGWGLVAFCDGHVRTMKHTVLYNGGNNYPYFDWVR